jgi:hypothetical protein
MPTEHVQKVLDNRVEDCEYYIKMIADIERDCMHDWPPGMTFVAGFGKAMTAAMKKYVEENRHLLAEGSQAKSATS